MKSFGITNQTKPFRQYFHKDVSHEGLNIVKEILWCDLPGGRIFCFLTVLQNGISNFYSIWLWRLLGAKGLKGGITFLSPSALPSKPVYSVS